MTILAIRTDKPEAELYLFDVEDPVAHISFSPEEQPERRIHSAPGAMRNREGVSYRPKATIKWEAHRQLAGTIHIKIKEILNILSISLKDIDGIVCFRGPGSFTGLRIGLTVANTLAYAQGIPIVARGGRDWLHRGIKDLLAGKNDKVAIPEYGSAAKTTKPKK